MSGNGNGVVRLTIDGRQVEAAPNETILQVARRYGIFIPTLCYDERLEPFGACRMCLVEVKGERRLMPACTTNVRDGMDVITSNDHIEHIRRLTLELILSDHPLDCMTCDSAGECDLMDLAYRYGIKENRFYAPRERPPVEDENLLIARDPSKCILCGRCVRICEEQQMISAIDFVGRGFEAEISTPFGMSLLETDCELCGQCISTCPTGALYEKQAIGRGRMDMIEKVRSVCTYCGVGCVIDLNVNVEDGRVIKITAPIGVPPNNGNLCVKGRFGFEFIHHPDRLTTPLIRRNGELKPCTWDEALDFVASKLSEIKERDGANAIAFISSSRCTNEENYLMQKLARAVIGTHSVDNCART